ncbi:MAG: beta-lactamase family protein [Acidobacteriia bacterium]|nr:beta-lactamase family protein [Terriglobia bacterium]
MTADGTAAGSAAVFPARHWEHRCGPQWSAELLSAAQAYSSRIGSSAVVIVQHGRIVAEWGEVQRRFMVASIRKSLLSALYGMAIEEGRVRLSDTLAMLDIDDRDPSLTEDEKRATLADLLTTRSGIYHPVDREPAAVAAQRPLRGSHAPGTFWYYNNWDFNAAGTIYEKVTGSGIFASFKQRVADRIGMEDFVVDACAYGSSNASVHRHYEFRLNPRDLARFGWLYLHGGRWQQEQIVPADWVRESTRPHASPHSELFAGRGYGYMWWTGFASDWGPTVTLPQGTFYALGFGAQYVLVIPRHDLVIVHAVDIERQHWPWISDHAIGRLLWLILSATGIGDVGRDTSFASVPLAARREGETLRAALAGATLRYAESALDGPYFMRLNADGSAALTKGAARQLAVHRQMVDRRRQALSRLGRIPSPLRSLARLDRGRDRQPLRRRRHDVPAGDADAGMISGAVRRACRRFPPHRSSSASASGRQEPRRCRPVPSASCGSTGANGPASR